MLLSLLVEWQEGRPVFKSSATTIPKSLLFGIGLTWSNLSYLTLCNSGKIGRLNKTWLENVQWISNTIANRRSDPVAPPGEWYLKI